MSGSTTHEAIHNAPSTAPLQLETQRLQLRSFTLDDATDVQRYAGNHYVARMAGIPYPYEDGMAEEWISSQAAIRERGERLVWAIEEREDGGLVGSVSIRLELESESASLGYWIGQPFWGHGYATEVVRAVIACGFDNVGLHSISARHIVGNPASGRVMEKAGMTYEATLRHLLRRGDEWLDFAYYSVLESEYRT